MHSERGDRASVAAPKTKVRLPVSSALVCAPAAGVWPRQAWIKSPTGDEESHPATRIYVRRSDELMGHTQISQGQLISLRDAPRSRGKRKSRPEISAIESRAEVPLRDARSHSGLGAGCRQSQSEQQSLREIAVAWLSFVVSVRDADKAQLLNQTVSVERLRQRRVRQRRRV